MKDLKWIKKGYFAHRGLHNESIPENTMAAFLNAVNNGFDIELDIRMTKDKQIVVFHDSSLKRLCNQEIIVEESNYKDINDYKILKTQEKIPLLTNVLSTLPKETEYLIELKPNKNAKELVRIFLELMKNFSTKYAIHSFDPRIVNQFKKQDPSIIRGQIASTFPKSKKLSKFILKHLITNIYTKPDFTNYCFEDLPRKKLDRLYKNGHMILSYVAKTQEGLDFVRDRYDNAVFENFIPKK